MQHSSNQIKAGVLVHYLETQKKSAYNYFEVSVAAGAEDGHFPIIVFLHVPRPFRIDTLYFLRSSVPKVGLWWLVWGCVHSEKRSGWEPELKKKILVENQAK